MKTFITLTKKDALGLDKEIYVNAKRLEKDAHTLVDVNKSYATATSLLILSLEELVKAIVILLHSQGYKIYQIKDIRLVFSRHEFRYWVAQFLETTISIFNIDAALKKRKQTPLISGKSKSATIGNGILTFLEAVPQIFSTYKNISNLENFNDYKNKGFYVDYRNEIQIPVIEIDEIKYTEVKAVYKSIDELYQNLIVFFDSDPKTAIEVSNKKQKEHDLKLMIDDALKDFSLKEIHKEISQTTKS